MKTDYLQVWDHVLFSFFWLISILLSGKKHALPLSLKISRRCATHHFSSWIPGNLIHSPLKGQGAARCFHRRREWLTLTPGPLGKGPTRAARDFSPGLSQQPQAPAVLGGALSTLLLAKFPSDTTFPQKSYAVWLAITSDWHSWLFTIRRELFPTGGHKLLRAGTKS